MVAEHFRREHDGLLWASKEGTFFIIVSERNCAQKYYNNWRANWIENSIAEIYRNSCHC
jgi:hypothetical protein